jgi:hypothetical protein
MTKEAPVLTFPASITRQVFRTVLLCLSVSWVWSDPASANTVNGWSANASRAALAACIAPGDDPLHESRMYAMMHVAIHDALNAIERRSRPYAFNATAPAGTSADAAIAAAARDVLVATIAEIPAPFPEACLDAGIASVEADYAAALGLIPAGPARAAGIALGQASAAAILARRVGDGSDTPLLDFDFPQGTEPGEWRFTGAPFAFAPGWGDVRPFVLQQANQFRPAAPYPVTSHPYTVDFEEVKALGGDGVTTPSTRTADQTQAALFWLESSPLMWNRIARDIAESRGLDDWQSARLFGLLNMAMADGYIGSWRAKYDFLFWRPVTAIQTADTDGNPNTTADPTWTPLQPTYPMPDHDSGHSVQGGAAAEALKRFFGTDDIAFQACSFTLPVGSRCIDAAPVLRSFASFSEAAVENGNSRIYVGIHFRRATEEGTRHGRRIAARAVKLFLRPVRDK